MMSLGPVSASLLAVVSVATLCCSVAAVLLALGVNVSFVAYGIMAAFGTSVGILHLYQFSKKTLQRSVVLHTVSWPLGLDISPKSSVSAPVSVNCASALA